MKKAIINLVLVIILLIFYYLQSNFFSWFNIAGIMPNLFIILVLFIGLFANRTMGIAYGVGIGIFLDFLIGSKVGIYATCLGLIGFLTAVFDKNFSKDSRLTIMVIVMVATIISEVLNYLLGYIFLSVEIEILSFIKILIIETIFNIMLTIILYPIIQKFGYDSENEYKGNKILTRYF